MQAISANAFIWRWYSITAFYLSIKSGGVSHGLGLAGQAVGVSHSNEGARQASSSWARRIQSACSLFAPGHRYHASFSDGVFHGAPADAV